MPVFKLDNSPRCQHLKLNGSRCAAPARRHRQFCVFHEAAHSRKHEDDVRLVEDAMSLQLALAQTIRELAKPGAISEKRIALKLYALQIASSNLRRLHQELLDCDMDVARRKWLENYLNQNNVTPDLKRQILADFDAEFLAPNPSADVDVEPETAREANLEGAPGKPDVGLPGSFPPEQIITSAPTTVDRRPTTTSPAVIPSLQATASPEKPPEKPRNPHRHAHRAAILRLGRAPSLRMTSG